MASTSKKYFSKAGFDANSQTVVNVADPVNAQDAATKAYSNNASNLSSGTVAAARFPAFTGDATTVAGAVALTLAASGVTAGTYPKVTVDAKGRVTVGAALVATDIPALDTSKLTTGTLAAARMPAYTGDATSVAGAVALTLAASGVTAGSYGTAANVAAITIDAKGRVTAASQVAITPAAIGAIATTAIGAASGVASLDATGRMPAAQLPASIVGALVYQGTWNAATNVPALVSGTGTKGFYYKVSVAGTTSIDGGNTWMVGDIIAFNGTTWDWIDGGSTEVDSVAGRTGNVVLVAADIGGLATSATTNTTNAANITSGTLPAARMPAFTGDATTVAGAVALTLAASGVTAGTYPKVTVDAKGRVTAGAALVAGDIPDISATYQPKNNNLTSVAALSAAATGLVKMTAGVASLDATTYLTANQTVTVTGDATGSGSTAIALTLAASGVTAGTYKSVTVDAKGRVTGGTNPTTLAGYGITDALSTSGNTSYDLVYGSIAATGVTLATAAAGQTIDSVSAAVVRTAKYMVQATFGTAYHSTEIMALHDGTNTFMTEYNSIMTGAALATFDTSISGGNLILIAATVANAGTVFKITRLTCDV